MSDSVYRQRAARRSKLIKIILAAIILPACLISFVFSLFRDTCTGSFDRQPEDVITSFVEAISRNNPRQVIRCWERSAYFSLESGCSEICLSRIIGIQYQLVDIELLPPSIENGRTRIRTNVTIGCPNNGEQHTGEVTLDTVSRDLPWRHWKIVESNFGGPLAEPWCK